MFKTATLSQILKCADDWSCPAAPLLHDYGYFAQARVSFHGWTGTQERLIRLYGLSLTVAQPIEPLFWGNGLRDNSCEVSSLVEWDIPCTLSFGQVLEVMTQAFVRNVDVGVDPYDLEVLTAAHEPGHPREIVRLLTVIRNAQIDVANGLVPRDWAYTDFFRSGFAK